MKFNKEKAKAFGKKVLKGVAFVGGTALAVGTLYLYGKSVVGSDNDPITNVKEGCTLLGDFKTWEDTSAYYGSVEGQLCSFGDNGEKLAEMWGITYDAPCHVDVVVYKDAR